MELEKKLFFVYMAASALYQRRQKTVSFLCRHTRMHKKHILTKQWNYNNFAQILHSYVKHTDQALGCVFLVAHCNIIRASRRAAFSFLCHFLSNGGWAGAPHPHTESPLSVSAAMIEQVRLDMNHFQGYKLCTFNQKR